MAKGSVYEREVCVDLSKWWTNGAREDIFWRSTTSGARATTRSKQGKQTKGQYGDVCATDPIGQPLIDAFTIEIKRGYPKATIHDLLDRSPTAACQPMEKFFVQTINSHLESGSWSWWLITKRDRREPLIWMPRSLLPKISTKPWLSICANVFVRCSRYHIIGMKFNEFLLNSSPKRVKCLTR